MAPSGCTEPSPFRGVPGAWKGARTRQLGGPPGGARTSRCSRRLSRLVRAGRAVRSPQGAPRAHRENLRGAGRRPPAALLPTRGQACRRVHISWDFFLQQLNGSAFGGLGFLPPGPSAAAAAQLLGARVFKPRHRGPRLPAALLNSSGLRGMAPGAAPGIAGVRPTTHVGCL